MVYIYIYILCIYIDYHLQSRWIEEQMVSAEDLSAGKRRRCTKWPILSPGALGQG